MFSDVLKVGGRNGSTQTRQGRTALSFTRMITYDAQIGLDRPGLL